MSAKFHKSASPAAIATEVTSLGWLADATSSGGAPVAELLAHGTDWLETRRLLPGPPSRDQAREFGRRLAVTHAAGAEFYGAVPPGLGVEDAVLAELPSPAVTSPAFTSWGPFFAEMRLSPYLGLARDAGTFERGQAAILGRFIERVADGEFDAEQPRAVREANPVHSALAPQPPVARIHGDLWGGNIVWAQDGSDVAGTLIDPSAHGGHAETDLAELAVFGSPRLEDTLEGYQEVSPLANGWRERVPVHQLHMLLVHVVKFGAVYVLETMCVADRFA